MKKRTLFFVNFILAVVLNEHTTNGAIEHAKDKGPAEIESVIDMFVMFDQLMARSTQETCDISSTSTNETKEESSGPPTEEESSESVTDMTIQSDRIMALSIQETSEASTSTNKTKEESKEPPMEKASCKKSKYYTNINPPQEQVALREKNADVAAIFEESETMAKKICQLLDGKNLSDVDLLVLLFYLHTLCYNAYAFTYECISGVLKDAEPEKKVRCALVSWYFAQLAYSFPLETTINSLKELLNRTSYKRNKKRMQNSKAIDLANLYRQFRHIKHSNWYFMELHTEIVSTDGNSETLPDTISRNRIAVMHLETFFATLLFKKNVIPFGIHRKETEYDVQIKAMHKLMANDKLEAIWNFKADGKRTRISSILQFIEAEKREFFDLQKDFDVDTIVAEQAEMSKNRQIGFDFQDNYIRFIIQKKN